MIKRLAMVLLTFAFLPFLFTACDSNTETPKNPHGSENPVTLPEQKFESALEAYNFGKKYFEETAKFYESIFYATAYPQILGAGFGEQKINSRRYLSENGDFLYDTANYGMAAVSFSFIAAIKSGQSGIYYKKIEENKKNITKTNNDLYSNYSGESLNSLTTSSLSDFEATSGLNPLELLNYIINEETISETVYFKKGETNDDFAYSFKFNLNEAAHANYKKQVKYNSGYDYVSFSYLSLEFGMDKYGRILEIKSSEEYSLSAFATPKSKVEGVQYITYSKNPQINFDGFAVTYQN